MDQLLLDAKRLASHLREHNSSSDGLIDQANNLHLKLDAMKQVKNKAKDHFIIKFFKSSLKMKLWTVWLPGSASPYGYSRKPVLYIFTFNVFIVKSSFEQEWVQIWIKKDSLK